MKLSLRHRLKRLGYALTVLGLLLPLSVLVWRLAAAQRPAEWQRYSHRGLGISWSAPASWSLREVRDAFGTVLVLEEQEGPRAVLYISLNRDEQEYRSWDPSLANRKVAGLPAREEALSAGHNPAQWLVSLRTPDGGVLHLTLSFGPGFNLSLYEQLLASVSLGVEEAHIRMYPSVAALSGSFAPCAPDCGLASSSPNWCMVDVASSEWDGVDVYSNGSNFPYFYDNECPDYYGLKFQCVELIQRYYWERVGRATGTGSPSWGIASAYQAWWKHPSEYVPVANGSGPTPQHGDILIWRPEGRFAPHGHIGIVVGVSGGRVIFVHQNSKEGGVSTRAWVNGWIDDPYLYGWLHAGTHDRIPPDGAITQPAPGDIISTDVLHLEGWASDDESGLAKARFHAIYGETRLPLGQPSTSSPFSYDWDLAAAGVPNGPLTITLELVDAEGNIAYSPRGVVQLEVRRPTTTPAPTATPAPDTTRTAEPPPVPTPAATLPSGLYAGCQDLAAGGTVEFNRYWLLGGDLAPRMRPFGEDGQQSLVVGITEGPSLKGVSIAQQIIDIPREAAKLKLVLRYRATASVLAVYPQRIVIVSERGEVTELLALAAPYSHTGAWQTVGFGSDVLAPFRGQRIRLQFQVYNGGYEDRPAALEVEDLHLYRCP
ncbi:MAG: CHAP domain-containing protein [Chloroflexi bacterium]|mgnify:CR=1 FL=1|nr:CHAP domain-containing protein [Chloroflexota bacterium]